MGFKNGVRGGRFYVSKGGEGYQDRGMKKEGLFSLAWSEYQLKKSKKQKTFPAMISLAATQKSYPYM